MPAFESEVVPRDTPPHFTLRASTVRSLACDGDVIVPVDDHLWVQVSDMVSLDGVSWPRTYRSAVCANVLYRTTSPTAASKSAWLGRSQSVRNQDARSGEPRPSSSPRAYPRRLVTPPHEPARDVNAAAPPRCRDGTEAQGVRWRARRACRDRQGPPPDGPRAGSRVRRHGRRCDASTSLGAQPVGVAPNIVTPAPHEAGLCAHQRRSDDHPIESVRYRPVPMWFIAYEQPLRARALRRALGRSLWILTIDDAGRRVARRRGPCPFRADPSRHRVITASSPRLVGKGVRTGPHPTARGRPLC